uniref:Uncharacterized protein n=1 Tax=Romanomermis culicivorax TaxID=13658 RepID=A0A915JID7_ROMCU
SLLALLLSAEELRDIRDTVGSDVRIGLTIGNKVSWKYFHRHFCSKGRILGLAAFNTGYVVEAVVESVKLTLPGAAIDESQAGLGFRGCVLQNESQRESNE